MSGAFSQIFQGMLFLLIDIQLDWFDVALDAIGYFMMARALTQLIPESASFRMARLFAVLTGIVSLPAMIPLDQLQPFVKLQSVLDLFLMWFLCSGIVEVARAHANDGLAATARTVRTLTLAVSAISVLATLGGTTFVVGHLPSAGNYFLFIAIPLLIVAIAATVLPLVLVKRAETAFAEPVRTVHSS